MTEKSPAIKAAHAVSDIFSPIAVPIFAMAVALWLTPLSMLPVWNRVSALLGVTFITAVIPLSFIYTMIKLGKVSDMSISNPKQRTAPYCVAVLCYLGAVLFLHTLKAPLWLLVFFGGATLVSLLSMLITKYWKISAHAGGVAGVAALIFWLAYRGFLVSAPLLWVCGAIQLCGIMCWARLVLQRHTLGQVAAGTAMSFGLELGLLLIFC